MITLLKHLNLIHCIKQTFCNIFGKENNFVNRKAQADHELDKLQWFRLPFL